MQPKGTYMICTAKKAWKNGDGTIKDGPKHNEIVTLKAMAKPELSDNGNTYLVFEEYTPNGLPLAWNAKHFRTLTDEELLEHTTGVAIGETDEVKTSTPCQL